jgi:hypothetical protein
MIRRITRTYLLTGGNEHDNGSRASRRTYRRRRGNVQSAPRQWRSAQTSPPGGVFQVRRKALHATLRALVRAGGRRASLGSHWPIGRPTTPSATLDRLSESGRVTRATPARRKQPCPRLVGRISGGPISRSEDLLTLACLSGVDLVCRSRHVRWAIDSICFYP